MAAMGLCVKLKSVYIVGGWIVSEEIETLVKDYYRLRGWSAEGIPPDVGSIGTVMFLCIFTEQ
jgi:hypothetical protein